MAVLLPSVLSIAINIEKTILFFNKVFRTDFVESSMAHLKKNSMFYHLPNWRYICNNKQFVKYPFCSRNEGKQHYFVIYTSVEENRDLIYIHFVELSTADLLKIN